MPTSAPIPDSQWPIPGVAALPPVTLASRLRKYRKIWRVALSDRMVYRADFFISTFLRFLPLATTILLWHAIYAGTAAGASGEAKLAGYNLNEMVAYLLLVHISRMFSSMPGLAHGVARDIRDGSLKKYLLQPIDMISYLITYRIAHKMAYILMSAVPYAILFFLCRGYFAEVGWPDPWRFTAYVVSLLLGFVIGFFFEASIGMIGFWFLEVSSFLYVVMTLTFFLSGHMFPLDLLGPFWGEVLKSLPFQYLAYYPAAIFLGKVQGEALAWGLCVQFGWAVAFIGLSRLLFRMGLKRYSAFGG